MGLEEIRFNAAVVRAFVMFSRVAGWLVLLLGFAFLRNMPWAPFNLLAPG